MAASSKITPASVRDETERAKQSWLKKIKEEGGIEKRVHDILNANLKQVVAGLLGFDDHWGKWEVCHTNGKKSELTEAIISSTSGVATSLVTKAIKDFRLSDDFKRAILADYKRAMDNEMRGIIRGKANEAANDLVESILAEDLYDGEARPIYDPQGRKIGDAIYQDGKWVLSSSDVESVHNSIRILANIERGK